MAQYVDKNAIIYKIKEKRDAALMRQHNLEKIGQETIVNEQIAFNLNVILSFINTLKVKEVDLDKEFNDFLDNVEGVPRMWHSDEQIEWGKDIAKHFFELGLNAKKEETKQPEYSCTQSIYHRGKKHYWNIGDILAYYYNSSDCEGEHILGQIVDVKLDEEQDDWFYTFENGRIYYEEELLENDIYVKAKKK